MIVCSLITVQLGVTEVSLLKSHDYTALVLLTSITSLLLILNANYGYVTFAINTFFAS